MRIVYSIYLSLGGRGDGGDGIAVGSNALVPEYMCSIQRTLNQHICDYTCMVRVRIHVYKRIQIRIRIRVYTHTRTHTSSHWET